MQNSALKSLQLFVPTPTHHKAPPAFCQDSLVQIQTVEHTTRVKSRMKFDFDYHVYPIWVPTRSRTVLMKAGNSHGNLHLWSSIINEEVAREVPDNIACRKLGISIQHYKPEFTHSE